MSRNKVVPTHNASGVYFQYSIKLDSFYAGVTLNQNVVSDHNLMFQYAT